MKQKHILLLAGACILLFFTGCPQPDPPGSDPGTSLPAVTGVKTTCLQYHDRIHLTWDSLEGAESYTVFRYLHKSDTDFDEEFESSSNNFDDVSAAPDTLYFYKVAGVKDSVSQEKSPNFVKGIYSGTIDSFEPNEEKATAGILPATETDIEALIYSFSEGEAQDTDWYTYSGDFDLLDITITLPEESDFIGELSLQIENEDPVLLDKQENTVSYSGPENFYFFIQLTIPDPLIDSTEVYTIYLEKIF
jgi:hypothetical protein